MTEQTQAQDAAGLPDDDGPSSGLWQRMKADPEYAPEHLALEAVTRLGPKMAQELEKLKGQNPGAPADALANMVVYRYVNQSRLSGAVSGAVPLAGAVLDIGVLAWTQARMVLMLAATYGVDPTHPDRAVDLLVLQGIHKYTQTARAALGVARGRERLEVLLPADRPEMRKVMMRLALKLAQMAGVRAVKKMVAKLIPGAAIILGGVTNGNATKSLGARAVALYRRPPAGMPYPLPPRPYAHPAGVRPHPHPAVMQQNPQPPATQPYVQPRALPPVPHQPLAPQYAPPATDVAIGAAPLGAVPPAPPFGAAPPSVSDGPVMDPATVAAVPSADGGERRTDDGGR